MKLLLFDVNYKEGSTGNLIYELKKCAEENGHKVLACYGRGKRVKEPGVTKFAFDIETYLHAFLTRITGNTGCFSYISTIRLINQIERFKPDIVHINELHAYFVNDVQLIRYLKKHNYPVIMTVHCEYIYTGKCGHAYECDKWKSECGNCPHLHDYVSTLFFDRTKRMYKKKKEAFKNFDNLRITVPSKWSANRISKSFLKEYNTRIIHNGIDTEIFKPVDKDEIETVRNMYEIPTNLKVVLAVAPDIMSDAKGGKTILRLAEESEFDNFFVLIGVSDLNDVKRKDNILFLPKLEDKRELATFYSMSNVFVMCSKRETFSLTCAEALSCGTRIVAYKCGAPETVFMTDDVAFVEQGDFEELKSKLKDFLQYDWTIEDRIKCSKAARELYSKSNMLNEYMNLYEGIMNGE